MAEDILTKLDR